MVSIVFIYFLFSHNRTEAPERSDVVKKWMLNYIFGYIKAGADKNGPKCGLCYVSCFVFLFLKPLHKQKKTHIFVQRTKNIFRTIYSNGFIVCIMCILIVVEWTRIGHILAIFN